MMLTVAPHTPTAYFSAVKSGANPESDLNWNDATSKPTTSTSFVNGEGSFTPVTNGPDGIDGSYASTSGFWFSVPTTSTQTGSGYISGSKATLASGAVFVTNVEFTIPAGSNATWSANNVKISGVLWNKAISGTLNAKTASATYLQVGTPSVKWSASAPVITTNSDGSVTFKGTITTTTTQPVALTQSGTKYYGQVVIMPATVQVSTAYGWTYYQQTSYVQSASISYSGTGITSNTLTLTNALTTTSRINP